MRAKLTEQTRNFCLPKEEKKEEEEKILELSFCQHVRILENECLKVVYKEVEKLNISSVNWLDLLEKVQTKWNS